MFSKEKHERIGRKDGETWERKNTEERLDKERIVQEILNILGRLYLNFSFLKNLALYFEKKIFQSLVHTWSNVMNGSGCVYFKLEDQVL